MPYAVTHVLIVVIFLELFREYFIKNKQNFPFHYIFAGGIFSLLPDFDVAIYYFLSFLGFTLEQIHRTFSHNIFVPLFFLLLAFVSYKFKSKKLSEHHLKLRNIFLVIAFGIFIHLLLDVTIWGSIMPFYPLSSFSVGLDLVEFLPIAWQKSFLQSLDAALLVLWLVWLEVRHKISSFL